jgi:hypothetical protein
MYITSVSTRSHHLADTIVASRLAGRFAVVIETCWLPNLVVESQVVIVWAYGVVIFMLDCWSLIWL